MKDNLYSKSIVEIKKLIKSFSKLNLWEKIQERNKKILQLEQQVYEKSKELNNYKSYKTDDEIIKNLTDLYLSYAKENRQLKQELGDKEVKIKSQDTKWEKLKNYIINRPYYSESSYLITLILEKMEELESEVQDEKL